MGPMRPPFRLRCGASPEEHEGRRDKEPQNGGHGEGERPDRPYPAPHLGRIVEAREGFVRLFDAKELAQRPPAFLYLVDQQLLLRDAPPDLLVVSAEDFYGVAFVLELPVEGTLPDDLLGHRPLAGLEGAEYE